MTMFNILGEPKCGGILVVCDHASNHVPDQIDMRVDPALLTKHIAYDIGVEGVARFLVTLSGCTAFLATHSRLVADLNRYPDDASAIPVKSDGIEILGNCLDEEGRKARLQRGAALLRAGASASGASSGPRRRARAAHARSRADGVQG